MTEVAKSDVILGFAITIFFILILAGGVIAFNYYQAKQINDKCEVGVQTAFGFIKTPFKMTPDKLPQWYSNGVPMIKCNKEVKNGK